jgi:ribosomal protein S18 acetylase RimI-like enzyme
MGLERKMEQFGVLTLGSRLKRLSDYLFAQVQEVYVQCDIPISATYFPILKLLQTGGGLSVVEIAEQLHLSHPAVSKQTTKMIKAKLLEKTVDERDQRRSSLCISANGEDAMFRVEPILIELKILIEEAAAFSSRDFMESLAQLEAQTMDGRLADKVLDRLHCIHIESFKSSHQDDFYALNMAWLKAHFPTQITEYDHLVLLNPQTHVLEKGGNVWVATRRANKKGGKDRVLGAVVLMVNGNGSVAEIQKLSVVEHCRRKGIADALLSHVIDFAMSKGITTLTLETASNLNAAKSLYRKHGFVEKTPHKPSIYERTDIYMEKQLKDAL